MKKIVFAVIALSTYGIAMSQTPEDALRYSWLPATGTARVQALGGASGAIGGEISTIFSNPANIGFYKTGDLVFSGGLNSNKNKGTYIGNTNNTSNPVSGFLGTSGIVLGKENYRNGSIKSSAFGFAVNRTADFNNKVHYLGQNDKSSMADYFIEDVQKYGDYYDYGSGLAYSTYWIDTANGGTSYVSPASTLITNGTGLYQEQKITTSGGITELAIAGAANINDKFYFGGSIGLPILRYDGTRQFTEVDPTDNSTNGFNGAYFDDHLVTKGVGINVKAGIVYKATEKVRLGFALHSPTFYSITEDYSAAAFADVENYPTEDGQSTHSASSDVLRSEYTLQTPYKIMGSASFMFGNINDVRSQKGFLTADVEYVNYMASTFREYNEDDGTFNSDYYRGLNDAVDNAYKGAINARVGAELKFNTIMARVGGAYYGNPYKDIAGETGEIYQATGGLGYRNKGFFIDLGYVHTFGSNVVYPYRTTGPAFYGATIKNNNSRVLLTVGFKI